VFREIGANIVEGLGDGISAAAPQVTGLMKTITDGLTQDVSGMFKSVLLEGANFRTALSGILGGAADRLLDRGVSSLLGGIPGFASGTSFAPGGLALVGERGAELVNLPRGSQVIPNDQLRGLASGSAEVHVTVGVDPASGNLTAFVDRRAGMAVAQGAPVIMSAQDRRTAQNLETYTARRG
jgi:phage-related protein